jgi:hypothetical protein
MEFSYYILENNNIKCIFYFEKNKNIINIKIIDYYKCYNMDAYIYIKFLFDSFDKFPFFYIIYKLSLYIKKIINNKFLDIYIDNLLTLENSNSIYLNNENFIYTRNYLYSIIFSNIEYIW